MKSKKYSLGAYHDGTAEISSDCILDENFIMSPSPDYTKNLLNVFKFSNCSISQFKAHLLDKNLYIFKLI